jgi:hypothetical protein
MDSCEEQVIISCGLYILSEEGELAKRECFVYNVSSERRGRRISYSV